MNPEQRKNHRGGARVQKPESPRREKETKREKKPGRPRTKKQKILLGLYIALTVVAAIIVAGAIVFGLMSAPPEVALPTPTPRHTTIINEQGEEVEVEIPGLSAGRKEQFYTFLVAGVSGGNTDTMLLAAYDVPNQKIGMLSVPRDTLVDESSPKINSSLHGGIENLQDVVSDLVGYPIDFYITIDLDGFVELVDAVGGVEFDVPVEMYYSDPTQDLNIFFQPGMQHLDGQAAMEVCRFRKNGDGTGYPLGDIQRSETVRNLMVTVAKKLVSNIGKLDQFVDIFQRNIETNLSGTDITWFVTKAIGVNLSTGVTGGALPGDGNTTYRGTSYCYELEPAESLTMINQLVNPYTTSLTPEDVNFFQVNDANGRGMRADASMFKTAETEDGSAGTGSADTSVRDPEYD